MIGACIDCDHSSTDRVNDLGQIRCTRFSTFVSCTQYCDYYSNTKRQSEFMKKLLEGETYEQKNQ